MYVVKQWIKSVDERGQTYYYLRDGSKSQWNLPEVNSPRRLTTSRKSSSGLRFMLVDYGCIHINEVNCFVTKTPCLRFASL